MPTRRKVNSVRVVLLVVVCILIIAGLAGVFVSKERKAGADPARAVPGAVLCAHQRGPDQLRYPGGGGHHDHSGRKRPDGGGGHPPA